MWENQEFCVGSQSPLFSSPSSIHLVVMLGRRDNKNSAVEDTKEERQDISTRCYWSLNCAQPSKEGDLLRKKFQEQATSKVRSAELIHSDPLLFPNGIPFTIICKVIKTKVCH